MGREIRPGEESAWALLELTRWRFPDRKAGLIPLSREKIEGSADASRVATPLSSPPEMKGSSKTAERPAGQREPSGEGGRIRDRFHP